MTRKTKQAPSRSHEEATIESLQRSPEFAAAYLNDVLAEGDEQELLVALRRVADAFGGLPKLATRANLNATSLYRTLSEKGNPELRSLNSMLKAMGLRLAVLPLGTREFLQKRAGRAKSTDLKKLLRRVPKIAPFKGDDRV